MRAPSSVQGEVHMYGTHAELEERGVNTTQLLGLIKTEDEEDKEFEYDDEESDIEEEDKGGMCIK